MNTTSLHSTAFILHTRPYQENSLILQLFSQESGRFSLLAKGVKGKRSQARKALLQPFNQLQLEFVGRHELKTLIQVEATGYSFATAFASKRKALACAYYVSELILRALPEQQEFFSVYEKYRELLTCLSGAPEDSAEYFQQHLRYFEMHLLNEVGIAPDCNYDTEQNEITANKAYYLLPQQGFSVTDAEDTGNTYSGKAIIALASGEISENLADETKRITRVLLQEIIGDKPLQSRKLWQHITKPKY